MKTMTGSSEGTESDCPADAPRADPLDARGVQERVLRERLARRVPDEMQEALG